MSAYAVVQTGGKQYKVAVGDVVEVEKLEGERTRVNSMGAARRSWGVRRGIRGLWAVPWRGLSGHGSWRRGWEDRASRD